jgi:hypothetical protein
MNLSVKDIYTMKTLSYLIKPALLLVALVGFFASANGAWAADTSATASNAQNLAGQTAADLTGSNATAGQKVIQQVYGIIRFAYVFFYAIAVMMVAQSWMQFKQQKYEAMFASMGAALGLFLTPAIIDFIHGLGKATAS